MILRDGLCQQLRRVIINLGQLPELFISHKANLQGTGAGRGRQAGRGGWRGQQWGRRGGMAFQQLPKQPKQLPKQGCENSHTTHHTLPCLTSWPSGSASITTCTAALPGVSSLTSGVST